MATLDTLLVSCGPDAAHPLFGYYDADDRQYCPGAFRAARGT